MTTHIYSSKDPHTKREMELSHLESRIALMKIGCERRNITPNFLYVGHELADKLNQISHQICVYHYKDKTVTTFMGLTVFKVAEYPYHLNVA